MHRIAYAGLDGCPLAAFATHLPTDRPSDLPLLVLMHGGGPDHRSLVPLSERLASEAVVVLPDVRGYGASICRDPTRHTWARYVDDVVALLDALRVDRAIIGGAGLGTTISLRTAVAHPERVSGLVLISVEDIEDDAAKAAETAFMDAFAERARTGGINAAWAPILPELSPVIGTMVREAIDDMDVASIAAAAHIGHDRAFKGPEELYGLPMPALLFAGGDWRHPAALARNLAERLPRARLGTATMSNALRTASDFADEFAPEIIEFLRELRERPKAERR
ncbi:MAG: alpha/beta hydrolase [Labilithrix sp.]|nr:alpha/beta hydrolase [Labilithrix sp.]MCW5811556.1 alpha/beta hydrolase [Labilithrix sp.]